MRKIFFWGVLILLLHSLPVLAMDTEELDNINYSVGHFLGKDLSKNSVALKIDQLLDGLYDGTEKLEPQYSAEEMKTLLAAKKPQEKDLQQKINYAYGYQAGTKIAAAEIEFSPEPLLYGVTDVTDKKKPRLSNKEMTEFLNKLKKDTQ